MTNRDRDIGLYLGLVGPWAWALLGLYAAVFIPLALVAALPSVGWVVTLGSLALILGAAVLMVRPSRTPLSWSYLVTIGALCWGAVAIMLANLPVSNADSLLAWQLGAINFVLFAIELRGRIVGAWAGMAALVATVMAWSITATGDPWLGIRLTYGQAVSLAAGTVFATGLQRTARHIFAQQDAERVRAAEEAARSAGDAHRAAELAEVRALAGPLLQGIAAREEVDPRDAVWLEAALRDRIRGNGLAIDPLASALRRARERGIDALLLDDLGEVALDPAVAVELAGWAAERVDAMGGSRITIRIAPVAQGALLSIADGDGIVDEWTVPVAGSSSSTSSARRTDSGAVAT
jgi:hypothetical protein